MATYTFGSQPEDVLTNNHGDVLAGVTLSLYPTAADAVAGTSKLADVVTDTKGRWSYGSDTYKVVFAVTPDGAANEGEVWSIESYEYAIDPSVSETAALAAKDAAEDARDAALAAQNAAENTVGIQGPPGPKGDRGDPGLQGPEGESAYEVAVDNGFVGTETEWLASLKGPKGDPGGDGSGTSGVPETRLVTAGAGLTGGGALSDDITISAQIGSTSGTLAAGDDPRMTNKRDPNPHTHVIGDVDGLVEELNSKADADSPSFTGTVTGITPEMVGLGNVDNTSDLDKPISTAVQAALDDVSLAGIAGLPAGVLVVQYKDESTGTWPAVPSDIPDGVPIAWAGSDPGPSTTRAGDFRWVTPSE